MSGAAAWQYIDDDEQVLTHLALAYVLAGDRAAAALTCISKLRQLGGKHAADPRICFLALKVFLGLDSG